ncbi:hypothetical protein HLB35_15690 [Halomonas sp. TBZ9]|uniref:Uncharacterized protein n=1 Tax=Vreelandella azerica TaxID=2732867 RepID=A0A7Y3TZ16_9GAMM|nr:hypothetical protein [Halomonas azerica]NOG32837.1 hypothetical protein [Halomonas azerica]
MKSFECRACYTDHNGNEQETLEKVDAQNEEQARLKVEISLESQPRDRVPGDLRPLTNHFEIHSLVCINQG